MKPDPVNPPLCVALDVADLGEAERLLDLLADVVPVFKVGLELFCAQGPAAVRAVRERGADVFLDLKVNDIPRQAAGAVKAAGRAGVAYMTLHAGGGRAMLRAGREAAAERGPSLLVVSVLTSLDDGALAETGVGRSVGDQVRACARLASEEGADGLVLSPRELGPVRAEHPELFLVTPGVRPAGAERGDHRRVDTPAAAAAAGADLLVVGRPITGAPDPRLAADAVIAEIGSASVRAGR